MELRVPDLGDDDGFARLCRPGEPPRWPNAITIDRCRALLERSPRPVNPTAGEMDAIERLDGIAAGLAWRDVAFGSAAGRFAGAADVSAPRDRLRAIVCRAYALASALAAEQSRALWQQVQALDDRKTCADAARALNGALDLLTGPGAAEDNRLVGMMVGESVVARGISALARLLGQSGTAEEAFHQQAANAIELLADLAAAFDLAPDTSPSPMSSLPDVARLVFALRLAEMLAATAGVEVYFDQRARKRRGNDWGDILTAALDVVGLAEDHGLSGLLRRFRDDPVPWVLRNLLNGEWDLSVLGGLPSSGLLLDRGIGNPSGW